MQETLLTRNDMRARNPAYSDSNIYRWLNSPDSDFPTPIKIGARVFWRLSDVEAWERRQAERAAEYWRAKKERNAARRDRVEAAQA